MGTTEGARDYLDAEQQIRFIEGINTTDASERQPIIDPTDPNDSPDIIQFFAYHHLSGDLRATSKPFSDMAHNLVTSLPACDERTAALRKLLEAKDCAVRAMIIGRTRASD